MISFVRPEYLWLLLLMPVLWMLALLHNNRRQSQRRWWALGLRTLLMLALIGSLAGTQVVQAVDGLTTVFLLDSSDSISPSQRTANEAYIAEALEHMREEDRAAIIVFGSNALIERIPSSLQRLGAIQSVPLATRTNIAEALQLGMVLFPADTQKRLVLLSDGGENLGQALETLDLARQREIPIDVVPAITDTSGAEVAVTNIQAPNSARTGQEIALTATIESSVAQTVEARWTVNNQLVSAETISIPAGSSELTTSAIAQNEGFLRYELAIQPAQDTRPQNNLAAALVEVDGPPHILIVEGTSGDGSVLADALEAANIASTVIAPGALPTNLADLARYESLVLVNVPSSAIPDDTQKLIRAFVGDLGHGLVMVGGTQSYGVGGYTATPIEEALPVSMDVRNRKERPDIALVFVIDKSGSMDACHCNGGDMALREGNGERKIDIAKEAVTEAASVLGINDKLGVVMFDDAAQWTLSVNQVPSQEQIVDALAPIGPMGATNVVAGMEAAFEQLKATDARIKHVILLTDGWGNSDISSIVQEMNNSGITVSVVAAGNGSDSNLEHYAQLGGGRYYPARTMDEVPQIFLQETIQAVGTYIVEETFTPAYSSDSPILAELRGGLPPLLGYNGTAEKDRAEIALLAPDGSPVLAQWQYGLGRSIAWTSDLKGKWAARWIAWDGFPRFVAQMIGWTLPRFKSDNVTGSVEQIGTELRITIDARADDGQPLSGLTLATTLVGSIEGETPIATLTERGPGSYSATLPSPLPGTYLLQVRGTNADGELALMRTLGVVVPYSAEYRQNQGDLALLTALAERTGGRTLATPAQAFDHTLATVRRALPIEFLLLLAALLLLLADIAVRRLSLRRSDFAALRRPAPQAAQPALQPTLSGLSDAKQRARQRTQAAPTSADPPPIQPVAPPPPKAQAAPPPPAAADSDEPSDPLERLRKAKDRARRR